MSARRDRSETFNQLMARLEEEKKRGVHLDPNAGEDCEYALLVLEEASPRGRDVLMQKLHRTFKQRGAFVPASRDGNKYIIRGKNMKDIQEEVLMASNNLGLTYTICVY